MISDQKKYKRSSFFEGLFRSLTVFGFLFAYTLSASADLNLFSLSPNPTRISGVDFPRQDMVLFRGVRDAQYNYLYAVAAMLGDDRFNLESAMFRSVRELLQGKNPVLFSQLSGLQEEFILQGLQRLVQAKKQDIPMSPEDSIVAAREILEQSYPMTYVRTRAIDYNSGSRDDNPKAFIYSTLHFEVARIYSPNLVLFREKTARSLDMNYWNFVTNRKWVHTNRTYPDRGEFLTPFFVPANDVVGFQLGRKNFNADWTNWRPVTADLDLVFMKQIVDGVRYVLIFDGSQLQHIAQEGDAFCSATTRFDPAADIPRIPDVDCDTKPALMTVLRLCPSNIAREGSCPFAAKLFKNYALTQNINQELLDRLQAHRFTNDMVLQNSRTAVEAPRRPNTDTKPKDENLNKDTPPKTKKKT